ncbi:PepSY domain-containing protein [Paractinoplanes toevensis]|uniref:PepSY domain-containing protein n=1 Tax=Paractinoplanes toevensis TaxID=571911 RepID=A0A919W1Z2_9ACTN|nr:PepSY domain-containing protein [Actinoplanes toevensis]GIM88955.1 hypothetical protein Ato02nite_007480 [Actinoplanes toevensis]
MRKLRTKRVIIPTVAVVAALGVGSVAWATTASADADTADRALPAAERASAEQAALGAVSGGTVIDVEAGDDGDAAYEVEVRAADNTEWDVDLDAGFQVLRKTADN